VSLSGEAGIAQSRILAALRERIGDDDTWPSAIMLALTSTTRFIR